MRRWRIRHRPNTDDSLATELFLDFLVLCVTGIAKRRKIDGAGNGSTDWWLAMRFSSDYKSIRLSAGPCPEGPPIPMTACKHVEEVHPSCRYAR